MTETESTRQLVVVGVDGSSESADALRWAAGYSAATGATVRAVLAWHYPSAAGPAPVGAAPEAISGQVRQSMQDTVDKAVAEVFPDDDQPAVETRISYGHPAQVLTDESQNADLLVVGHRGHGAFTGMMLGSVSMHCVANAACSVTVVRNR